MGPGYHSGVEREVFASRFPFVYFPDQPVNISFEELLQWSEEQVASLYTQNGHQKINIVAHSFGGQLVKHLVAVAGDRINEVTLVNCAFDSFHCFERLAKALNIPPLQNNAKAEDILSYILQISSNPRFANLYWINSDLKLSYESKTSNYPALDVATFMDVFTGYLKRPINFDRKENDTFQGKVRFCYSTDDVLIDEKIDIQEWKNFLPQLEAWKVSGAGHHLLHERPDLAELIFSEST